MTSYSFGNSRIPNKLSSFVDSVIHLVNYDEMPGMHQARVGYFIAISLFSGEWCVCLWHQGPFNIVDLNIILCYFIRLAFGEEQNSHEHCIGKRPSCTLLMGVSLKQLCSAMYDHSPKW